MSTFPAWLRRIGLAHCGSVLQANGIGFETAERLGAADLCRLGLSRGDSETLVRALVARQQRRARTVRKGGKATAFPSERRQQLTVMFCDLVDSTGRRTRLDPEDAREDERTFCETCAAVATSLGGYVRQTLGDGLLVYFGWPEAHEDDAERCVRAALDMVRKVQQVTTAHEPLVAHIGIATGPVVVGGTQDAPGDGAGLAVGEAPNLAARLQGFASPGEILVDPTTYNLVQSRFEFAEVGLAQLKGFGSLRSWRVEAVRQGLRYPEGAPRTPLVGRRDEIERLDHEWRLASAGSGRAVVVEGEAGIGKSRLTQALRERLAGERPLVLLFQCSSFHQNVALHPVIAHLEIVAGFSRDETADQRLDKLEAQLVGSDTQRAEAAPLLAALLSLPTERYPPRKLLPQKLRERTLEVLCEQVDVLSRTKPMLMVVEDVHWIDPTTQELVDALVPRLPALQILLVVTARTRPTRYAPTWSGLPHVSTLHLDGLDPADSAELVGHVAGGRLPEDVLNRIVGRADGLPLFLEELTKSVLEMPHLVPVADGYSAVEPLTKLAIPPTLEALLIERLGRTDGVIALAQTGAAIGRVFPYELLAAMAVERVSGMDRLLAELVGTELVIQRGTGVEATFTFRHALIQDAAYNSIPLQRRRRLHAAIADVLERQFPQRAADEPEVLAHHRTEAGDARAAIPLWRAAGEAALTRCALQEAVSFLERGLSLTDGLDPSAERDRLELSLRGPLHTARLRWRGWASSEVGSNAAAILALANRQRDLQSLLVGLWGMWVNSITQGRIAESPQWARRLLDEGRQARHLDLEILGHRAMVSSQLYLGELEQSIAHGDRALALYDPQHAGRWMQLTGSDTRTAVEIFATQALWMRGYPDQARARSDAKDVSARAQGNPFDIGWAVTWGGYVHDYRRQPERLLAGAEEARRLGQEQGVPVLVRALAPLAEGLGRLRLGHLDAAARLLRTAIAGWQAGGGHLHLPYLKSALAEALARAGDLETGLRLLDECMEQIERPGWCERVWLPETMRLKGWMLMQAGRWAEAEAQLRTSLAWARRQRARSWELRTATTLAQLLARHDRRTEALQLLEPVYTWFTEGFDTHDLRAARALLEDLR